MEYLHISSEIVPVYKDDAGTPYKGISRPSGIWYGHGLSWVRFMESRSSWSPQIKASKIPVLPLYEHIFEGKTLLPKQKGDSFQPVDASLHVVYSLPIPKDAFQSPDYAGEDKATKILKLDPSTLDILMSVTEEERTKWYTTEAEFALEASYGGLDPLGSMTQKSEAYKAILQYLLSVGALNPKQAERAQKLLSGDTSVPLLNLKTSSTLRTAIANGVLQRKLPFVGEILDIEDLFWQSEMRKLRSLWGGIDFADALFEEGKEEYFKRLPLLRYIDAGSGVLFKPTQVLGKTDAISDIRCMIFWNKLPHYKNERIEKIPKYVFGLTKVNEVRILYPPSSGGSRSRTRRRRVFKNPKTLKKRVRKVVLLRML